LSLLTPLYIAGLLAVGLPIIFHMIRRKPKGRVAFSTLQFLNPSPPRITRRSRIENWPLLLLRALALILLALAFSRPFFRTETSDPTSASSGQTMALLIDISASMRREDLLEQALQKARTVLAELKPNDAIAIYTFAQQTTPIVSFQQWNTLAVEARQQFAEQQLSKIEPSWYHTNLDDALISVCEDIQAAQSTHQPNSQNSTAIIVLFSDLQSGSQLQALQTYEWPKQLELQVQAVLPKQTTNAAAQFVAESTEASSSEKQPAPLVRITNSEDATTDHFKIKWASTTNSDQESLDVSVPPGQSRIVRTPVLLAGVDQPQLVLEGDDHPFDNLAYYLRPTKQKKQVLYYSSFSADASDQPRYYLERAFPESARQEVQVLCLEPNAPPLFPKSDPIDLIVVSENVSDELAKSFETYLRQGGTLLFSPLQSDDCQFLSSFISNAQFSVSEAQPEEYAMLTDIDFEHPVFKPFDQPQFSDFSKLHFWKHRTISFPPNVKHHVLAKFDNGSAALTEIPIDEGRLFVLASGWHPAESQLALSSKFVPLLNGLLNLSSGTVRSESAYTIGEPIPLQSVKTDSSNQTTIHLPDESKIKLTSNEQTFENSIVPGIYTLISETSQNQYSVNLAPAESRTAQLPIESLEKLGVVMHFDNKPEITEGIKRQLANAEMENQQKVWRWLILVALGVLLLETFWAGRQARLNQQPTH